MTKFFLSAMGFFLAILRSVFHDIHKVVDEKKVWLVLYLALAVVVPFFIPSVDVAVPATAVIIALALYLGIPLSDQVPFLSGLKSLGLFDLITNKANQGDLLRVVGNLLLAAGFVYVLAPLWSADAQVRTDLFLLVAGLGAVICWGAIWGDRVAVQNAKPEEGIKPMGSAIR